MKPTLGNYIVRGVLIVLAMAVAVLWLTSCGTTGRLRNAVSVRDSVRVRDSVVVHDSFVHSSATVSKDTAVGISGNEIVYNIPLTPLNGGISGGIRDTDIRSGSLSLDIYHGRIVCKEDSLTLVIRNLTSQLDSSRFMSNFQRVDSVVRDSSTVLTMTGKTHWYSTLWEGIKNLLALFGLGCGVALVIRFTLKKAFV